MNPSLLTAMLSAIWAGGPEDEFLLARDSNLTASADGQVLQSMGPNIAGQMATRNALAAGLHVLRGEYRTSGAERSFSLEVTSLDRKDRLTDPQPIGHPDAWTTLRVYIRFFVTPS